MKKRRSAGIITIIIFVLVLFIPSYIAIASYDKTENKPPEVEDATMLNVSDINGAKFNFTDEDADGKAIIDLFSQMISGSTRVDELPVNDGTPCYLVSFSIGETEKLYQFYFSKNADSYFVDKDAKVFRIPTEKASAFLNTPYAASLFNVSSAPTLVLNGTSLLPNSIRWKFRTTQGGELVEVDPKSLKTSVDTQTATSDGSLDLVFDMVPNHTVVVITDENGKEIYNGAFINDELSKLSGELKIKESTVLHVSLEAEWNETETLDYSGKAKYEFNVDFAAPAVFSLGEGTVTRGGIVLLTAKNVKDASKITFTSNPALTSGTKTITPTFYSDGKNSAALIMIDCNTENTEYEFTVSYGAVTQTLKLKVDGRTYRSGYTSSVSAAIAQSHRSAAALSAFDNMIKSQLSKTSNVPLWDGKFGYSIDEANPSYALGFGHTRTITSTGESYQNMVVDYYVAAGSDIIAVQNGKVIYVGVADYPGKFVIVDHGLGLFSVYLHLGDYTVKEGDTVEKGDVIGSAGTSGFIAATGANHSIMYVQNGEAFCGYELEEKGIPGSN